MKFNFWDPPVAIEGKITEKDIEKIAGTANIKYLAENARECYKQKE